MNKTRIAFSFLASASLLGACADFSSGPDEEIQTEPNGTRIIRARDGALTAPSTAAREQIVREYLRGRGVAADQLRATHEGVGAGGVTHIQLEQTIDGLRVHDAYVKAAIDQDGQLLQLIERVVPATGVLAKPAFDERAALGAALGHLSYDDATPAKVSGHGNKTKFAKGSTFHKEPEVERVAYLDGAVARAGFLVETWSDVGNQLDYTLVGATGAVVSSERRTNNADSYKVFVEDPSKGDRLQTVVDGPAPGSSTLSPNGWLGAGTQKTTNILGNNVNAYLDAKPNNAPDTGGTLVGNGQFLTTHDPLSAPSTTGNRAVAVQNLFYLNNVVHDRLYEVGFTESEKNFQEAQFEAGGLGSDSVNAEAQDGSGTDNANFATPTDGSNPRMQMFLWNSGAPNSFVHAGGTTYGAFKSSFGPTLPVTGVPYALALYDDGSPVSATSSPTDGCQTSTVSLANKIALVDRGNCDFTVKVMNAQNAGAKGVIIANNVPGAAFSASGSGRFKIPSVMVTQSDGVALRSPMPATAALAHDASPRLMIDADLDSDIVFHEYGHGLTWRMIGGMSGPISGAIGEGAADVLAFLINGDDQVAEYSGSGTGIRRHGYAGYPLTYSDVTGAEVHNDGEIYAAAMWRLLELNLAAGLDAQTVLALFVDGMNFTPMTPRFEHMRQGMITSALSDPAQECRIWQAFAAFGMGAGSSSTQTGSTSVAIVESFVVPAVDGTTCQ